jgi:L-malate glycosyltransferase
MGGAERYLLSLLPELKKRNIEVGFFCTLQNNNKEIIDSFTSHFAQYEIPVHVCKAAHPYSLKAAFNLAKIIKKEQYNILSAHLIHAEIVSAMSKMLFRSSCELVTTKHGYLQKFMDQHGLDYTKINSLSFSYLVEKNIQRVVTKNFAVSKAVADLYVQSGICKAEKMEVIYHGLDAYSGAMKVAPIRYSDNQILVIARLKKFKGHSLIIEAVRILSEEIPDLKLVILGVGEEMSNLVNLVKKYKLNNWVSFEGHVENVYDYINGSDIIVVPSLAEPFGLIVLEAYSCAKPVIAFDVPAFNENIIDGESGFLVPAYDIQILVQKIKHLLQNKSVAKKMGENGLALLKSKFSQNTSVEQTISFFRDSLKLN